MENWFVCVSEIGGKIYFEHVSANKNRRTP